MSVSNISSRAFNPSSFNTAAPMPKPPVAPNASELGSASSSKGFQFKDMFQSSSASSSGNVAGSQAFGDKLHHALKSAGVDDETIKKVLADLNGGKSREETSASSGTSGSGSAGNDGPGSQAFGDKLQSALKNAGVDDETIKKVLAGLNGGKARGDTSSASGTDSASGPGSQAFGDKLENALKAAGVDDDTAKTVLAGLNNGQARGTSSTSVTGANELSDLMSQLDDDSRQSLQGDTDALDQLKQHPELAAQLAQNPEVFKALMGQQSN